MSIIEIDGKGGQPMLPCERKEILRFPDPLDTLNRVRHICLTMKTATVRDLRNHFPRIAVWIEQGQQVEITRAGKVFARLVPAPPLRVRRFKMPDIMARLNQTFGPTSYDSADMAAGLEASRGDRS